MALETLQHVSKAILWYIGVNLSPEQQNRSSDLYFASDVTYVYLITLFRQMPSLFELM